MTGTGKKIGVAVVGCGYWGPNLMRNFSDQPGCELRWLVDRDPQRLARCAARHPQARAAADLSEALADAELHGVAIATPVNTHFALTGRDNVFWRAGRSNRKADGSKSFRVRRINCAGVGEKADVMVVPHFHFHRRGAENPRIGRRAGKPRGQRKLDCLMSHQKIAPDVVLGKDVKIYDFVNLYGCTIGDRSKIGTFVEIQKGARIGADCKISSHTFICEGVQIKDGVFVGHNVSFINDKYPRAVNADGSLQTDKDWKVIPRASKKARPSAQAPRSFAASPSARARWWARAASSRATFPTAQSSRETRRASSNDETHRPKNSRNRRRGFHRLASGRTFDRARTGGRGAGQFSKRQPRQSGRRRRIAADWKSSRATSRTRATCLRAAKDIGVIFHLACLGVRHSLHNPLENHQVNALGTLNVLEAARAAKVQRFVYVSTSEVYGRATDFPIRETTATWPLTVYGGSKLAGEHYARAYFECFGLPAVCVRPFNNYGPRSHFEGDTGEVIPRFMLRALSGLPPVIFGDGSHTRDFLFVRDCVETLAKIAECDALVGGVVNLGYRRGNPH